MKKRHFSRGLTALLVPVMLFSAMITTAFATENAVPYSNEDHNFFEEAPVSSSFAQTPTASKDDDSAAWLRIDSMTNGTQVRVRIVGSSRQGHACEYSEYNYSEGFPTCKYCTRCTTKGSWVPFVRCRKSVNYAVSSIAYECGYRHSSIGFQSTSLSGLQEVSGFWSADSVGKNYAKPED